MYGTVMVTQKNEALGYLSKKDFVIWLTGTNDRYAPGSYKENIRSYLDAVRDCCGGMLVISGIPSTETDEDTHPATMQQMDEIITAAVTGFVPHFSMYQAFSRYCENHDIPLPDCFADHVHPNDLGHYIIFKLLCQNLGLPLDPYEDYQYYGNWWLDSDPDGNGCSCDGTDDILITNTDTRTESMCTEGVYLDSTIIPCSVMTDYNSETATTALSGKHITRAVLHVFTPGLITFGTVDLEDAGQASPTFLNSKQLSTSETGMVEFSLHMDIGPNQTLAVQSVSDTGKLGFFVTYQEDPDDNLRIWKPGAFLGTEPDVGIHLFGTIYGI